MHHYWLILLIIAILILIAMSPRSWGEWAREGWKDLNIMSYARAASDIQVRADYRRRACEHVPPAHPGDYIRFPDPILDRFIFEEKFEEANTYRIGQMKLARERRDKDAVESYTIYKSLISRQMALYDERRRLSLRERFPRIKHGGIDGESAGSELTEIVGSERGKRRKRIRSRFLEIDWKFLPVNLPPADPQMPDKPVNADDKKPDKDDDDYSDLISI